MELVVDARRPLLEGAVDYLSADRNSGWLERSTEVFQTTVRGRFGWIVGRFCCPSSRLEDLAGILTTTMEPGDRPWHVSVVVDESLGSAALHAGVFHRYVDPAGAIASIEIGASADPVDLNDLATVASGISPPTAVLVPVDNLGAAGIADLSDMARTHRQPVGGILAADALDPISNIPAIPLILAGAAAPTDFVRLAAITALTNRGASPEEVAASPWSEFLVTAVGLRWRSELVTALDIRRARSVVRGFRSPDLELTFDQMAAAGLIDG